MTRFKDRRDAGRRLADQLANSNTALHNPLTLGLPRGGIPVAAEIAHQLSAPLDVFVAHKIGAPGREELGIGAAAEGDDDIVTTDIATRLGIDDTRLRALAEHTRREIDRRVHLYRGNRPLPQVDRRVVVLVDDGLATGVTAEAALNAIRQHNPHRLVLAVPVAARESITRLAQYADDIVCAVVPEHFFAVGEWYDDFDQITDDEVKELLNRRSGPAGWRASDACRA